jgi:hypothetical protein
MNLHDVSFPEEIVPLHPLAFEGVTAPHPGKLKIPHRIRMAAVSQLLEGALGRQHKGGLEVGGLAGGPGIDPDQVQEGKEGRPKFREAPAGVGGGNPDRKVVAQNLKLQLQILGVGKEVGLELVSALVFGHDGQHFFQVLELFANRPGLPGALLYFEVLGRQVDRHGPS